MNVALDAVHALEKTGIKRDQAEAIVQQVERVVEHQVATKGDLAVMKAELSADITKAVSGLKSWFVVWAIGACGAVQIVSRVMDHYVAK